MTDLFRGYDLTTVADQVARKSYERALSLAPIQEESKAERTWDLLPATAKHQIKSDLLPIISDVLDALNSPGAQPPADKAMVEYAFVNDKNPVLYENQYGENGDPDQHHTDTATTWVLHMHIKPSYKERILARMAKEVHTTGEFSYGDSFREWNEPSEGPHDVRLGIFYDASPDRTRAVGTALATAAAFAVDDPDMAKPINVTISTSGDYAEQLEIE